MSLSKKQKNILINSSLVLASVLFLLMILEIFVRVAVFKPQIIDRPTKTSGISRRVRELVCYWSSFDISDEGFRLALYLDVKYGLGTREVEYHSFDPDLGWVAGKYDENNPITPYRIDEIKTQNKILFVGDSFVYGLTEDSKKIPHLIESYLGDVSVLNLGVCGYGYDQTFLRMRKSAKLFDRPHILMGIFCDNLDRCLLKMRGAPKPYFFIEGDSLVLKNIINEKSPEKWIETYPPNLYRSFAIGFIKGLIHKASKSPFVLNNLGPSIFYYTPKSSRDEVKDLFSKLIDMTVAECNNINADLSFVVFPFSADFEPALQSWQYSIIKQTLDQKGLKYIDCSEAYQSYLEAHPELEPHSLLPLIGHPDAELNQFIADQITEYLSSKYEYTLTSKNN